MTRALVIGGKGFIGGHLGACLERHGVEVSTYDAKDGQDVLDRGALRAASYGCDVAYHLAGILGTAETFEDVGRTIRVNMLGTMSVLEVCEEFSLPLVYLGLKTPWHSPYLITKRAAAELVQGWAEYRGLRATVVRGLNVYGPGQHWGKVEKFVPTTIVRALRGEPLRIYGDGQQITDQIYVRDVCEVLYRVWERDAWGQELDACTGIPTTVETLARLIIDLTGSRSEIRFVPMRPGEPHGGVQLGQPTKQLTLLGFSPDWKLEEGMAETVDWYRDHYQEVEDRG